MTPAADWGRVWEVFHAALERSATERAAYLDQACGDDVSMRRELDDLLASHAEMQGFLAEPGEVAALLDDQEEARRLIGQHVGPFEIVRLLGEGGMGAVYEARQQAPIRRRVALKLIKLGMNSKEVAARFESERQALALMNHPGIAAVLDCGAAADGRPYFVMELVDGPTLTEYCDEHRLDTRARLALFEDVCRAVQHAHRKGVIHRDLKPSNVLIAGGTEGESGAQPKIIDFGVAKAINQRLTERTLYTELGKVIGTPEYMSPEQAAVGADIDTQSDVYSLGVILYELLVGAPPFDFRGKPYPEMQRILQQDDPPTPSTRLASDPTLSEAGVAEQRPAGTELLRRDVPGELDWIVMKALEKERAERYGSAAELAADVRRYLDDEPVVAAKPSALYRARKFARRHRVAVTATAAVLAALVAGLVGTSWMAIVAARQTSIAEEAQREAEAETRFAQSINDLLIDMVSAGDPWQASSDGVAARDLKVIDVLDRTAAAAGEKLAGQPLIEAGLRAALGRTYLRLAMHEEAERELRLARDLLTAELGPEHPKVLGIVNDLGVQALNAGRIEEAEELLANAVEARARTLGVDDPETIASRANLAQVWVQLGNLDAAHAALEETVVQLTAALGPDAPDTLTAASNLGWVRNETGDLAGAETLYRDTLARQQRLLGPDHPSTLATLNNLASNLQADGRLAESEQMLAAVVEGRRRTLGSEHPRTLEALNNLSVVLFRQQKSVQAEAVFREIDAIYVQTGAADTSPALATRNNLARVVMDQGRLDEADAIYEELMERAGRVLPPNNVNLALFRGGYGSLLVRFERFDDAIPQLESSYAVLAEGLGTQHARTLDAVRKLVDVYERAGNERLAAKYRALLPPSG